MDAGLRRVHSTPVFTQLAGSGGNDALDLMCVDNATFFPMWDAGHDHCFGSATARIPCLDHLFALKLHALRHAGDLRVSRDAADFELPTEVGPRMSSPGPPLPFDLWQARIRQWRRCFPDAIPTNEEAAKGPVGIQPEQIRGQHRCRLHPRREVVSDGVRRLRPRSPADARGAFRRHRRPEDRVGRFHVRTRVP
jgi:hypothetical protein